MGEGKRSKRILRFCVGAFSALVRLCVFCVSAFVRLCVCAFVRLCVCAFSALVRLCVFAFLCWCVGAFMRLCVSFLLSRFPVISTEGRNLFFCCYWLLAIGSEADILRGGMADGR